MGCTQVVALSVSYEYRIFVPLLPKRRSDEVFTSGGAVRMNLIFVPLLLLLLVALVEEVRTQNSYQTKSSYRYPNVVALCV